MTIHDSKTTDATSKFHSVRWKHLISHRLCRFFLWLYNFCSQMRCNVFFFNSLYATFRPYQNSHRFSNSAVFFSHYCFANTFIKWYFISFFLFACKVVYDSFIYSFAREVFSSLSKNEVWMLGRMLVWKWLVFFRLAIIKSLENIIFDDKHFFDVEISIEKYETSLIVCWALFFGIRHSSWIIGICIILSRTRKSLTG